MKPNKFWLESLILGGSTLWIQDRVINLGLGLPTASHGSTTYTMNSRPIWHKFGIRFLKTKWKCTRSDQQLSDEAGACIVLLYTVYKAGE